MKTTAPLQAQRLVKQARSMGFELCGVAPADDFEELRRLPEWLERGHVEQRGKRAAGNALRDCMRVELQRGVSVFNRNRRDCDDGRRGWHAQTARVDFPLRLGC